ncbi:MAG TPA: sigma 54-interacting transcriptional regulator [Terriglobia bacterium]|nr:sigma 54-interacting transcriptional regulator [Terriglobia bacterium]
MRAEIKSPHSILDKYTALVDISCRLNSEKNFDQLLKLIADEATKHLDSERATIFILDKEKGELWAKVALGVSDTIRFDARLGVAGAVLIAGKPMIVEDAYKSPLFYQSIDSITGFHTRNILSVPLRNPKQEVIGVFQVLNKREGRFTSDDERFVEALANQAAVALENSLALSELENRQQLLIEENQHLRKEIEERFTSKTILGTSSKINEIRSIIDKTAETSVSVLITGENGTGKELSARAIHYTSSRRPKPFVAVNCAAVPEPLVESELFGIEKGVATGVERRVGRIESANGGTLFLDEIGDLSLTAQAKLLRVLQEREVEWVGGRRPVPVDIRLVAATNKDLKEEIKQNRFRQDLFFRLNVIHIRMPALREFRPDIALLAAHFLRKYAKEMGRDIRGFSQDALKTLMAYHWPGNVRELENEVKRAVVLAAGPEIQVNDLSEPVAEERLTEIEPDSQRKSGEKQSLKDRVTTLEIQMIRDAMAQTDRDRRRAAKILGLSHQGLINKLKRYGLED